MLTTGIGGTKVAGFGRAFPVNMRPFRSFLTNWNRTGVGDMFERVYERWRLCSQHAACVGHRPKPHWIRGANLRN